MKTFLAAFLALCLIAGCAGVRYPNTAEKNLVIDARIEQSQFYKRTGLGTKMEAFVGVHAVGSDCRVKYLGFIPLVQGTTEIGLPPGQLTLLVLEISTSRPGGNRSSTSRQTLLRPKPGHTYQLDVSYINSMFDLRLHETGGGIGPRGLELVPLSACGKL